MVKFARWTSSRQRVYALDVPAAVQAAGAAFECEVCSRAMILAMGPRQAPHFRHTHDEDESCCPFFRGDSYGRAHILSSESATTAGEAVKYVLEDGSMVVEAGGEPDGDVGDMATAANASEPKGAWHIAWQDVVDPRYQEQYLRPDPAGRWCIADMAMPMTPAAAAEWRAVTGLPLEYLSLPEDSSSPQLLCLEIQHSPITAAVVKRREVVHSAAGAATIWIFDASSIVADMELEAAVPMVRHEDDEMTEGDCDCVTLPLVVNRLRVHSWGPKRADVLGPIAPVRAALRRLWLDGGDGNLWSVNQDINSTSGGNTLLVPLHPKPVKKAFFCEWLQKHWGGTPTTAPASTTTAAMSTPANPAWKLGRVQVSRLGCGTSAGLQAVRLLEGASYKFAKRAGGDGATSGVSLCPEATMVSLVSCLVALVGPTPAQRTWVESQFVQWMVRNALQGHWAASMGDSVVQEVRDNAERVRASASKFALQTWRGVMRKRVAMDPHKAHQTLHRIINVQL